MVEKNNPDNIEAFFWAYRRSSSEDDLEQVVNAGRKLVYHFARLYGSLGEDVLQVGMEGLLKAVSKFNPECGNAFVTYASHCIMGEIRHFIRKEASYYKPGSVADLQGRVERVIEEGMKVTGEPPALSEIAATLNVKEEGIVQAMRAGLVSLDELDVTKIKSLKYETFRLPIEDKIVLEQAINKLSELQKRVVYLLFYKDMTQNEAADELGISQRKVSRILHKSLQQLYKWMKLDKTERGG
jgi:RNA polymerase sigma-B factor